MQYQKLISKNYLKNNNNFIVRIIDNKNIYSSIFTKFVLNKFISIFFCLLFIVAGTTVSYGLSKNNFPNDSKISKLIDSKQKIRVFFRKISISTKNKGVPDECLGISRKKNVINNKEDKKLKKAKSELKENIKQLLIKNDISKDLTEYIYKHLEYIEPTIKKHKEFVNRKMIDFIDRYDVDERAKTGKIYKKKYKKTLLKIENLFNVDSNVILSIWAMETKYGDFIGNYDAFNALYSACINSENMKRLTYFRDNIIYLAKLVDGGYFKKNVISSFDGGIGGCQFMPESIYRYAISLDNKKADIINNNKDVLASIGNYLHSNGWRYNEGILTEVELPEKLNPCLIGMNTTKKIKDWEKLGIKIHNNKIGAKYAKNKNTKVSIIVTDPNDKNIKKKRAFFVYDNYKVIMSYNPRIAYGLTAGLIFEGIGE